MEKRAGPRSSRRLAATSLAVLGAVASLLIGAEAASAEPCRVPLADSQEYGWDTGTDGSIESGTLDAYDGWGKLRLGLSLYPGGDPNGCTREEDGREIVFPAASVGGLTVTRKVYVPPTGPAVVRFLDVLRNQSALPVIADVSYEGDLGSDGCTAVLETSSLDNVAAPPDRWATSADTFSNDPDCHHDPPLAHIWDGPGLVPDAADAIYGDKTTPTPWVDGGDIVRVVHQNVTVNPGQTVAFMYLEAQRPTIGDALLAAQSLGNANNGNVFRGLSGDELGQIRNWRTADVDNDGVSSDNCPFDSNFSQSNLDGDGSGDACDTDIDGDGVGNSDEAAKGTSPTVADSDGDGKVDGADGCPTKAGQGTDGCPRFDTLPAPAPAPAPTPPPLGRAPVDSVAPKLTLKVGRVVKRKLFLKGLTAAAVSDESASLEFELRATASKVRISKAFNLTLASQRLPVGRAGTRAVRLRPARALIGKARKFTVVLRVTAEDRSGNRTVRTAAIAVR